MFYFATVKKYYITVTLGWHDSIVIVKTFTLITQKMSAAYMQCTSIETYFMMEAKSMNPNGPSFFAVKATKIHVSRREPTTFVVNSGKKC